MNNSLYVFIHIDQGFYQSSHGKRESSAILLSTSCALHRAEPLVLFKFSLGLTRTVCHSLVIAYAAQQSVEW